MKISEDEATKEEEVENVEETQEDVGVDAPVDPSSEEVIIEEDSDIEINEKKTHKKAILISAISVVALLIVVILSTGFALLNIGNNGMILGIAIKDVDIKGLNKSIAEIFFE